MNQFQFGFQTSLGCVLPMPEENFEEFYKISLKICELEALTFQTEENKNNLILLYSEFKKYTTQFDDALNHRNTNWRLFASLYCTFMEWCENVCYFNISEEEQKFIWSENPLNSLSMDQL
ncbi:MAG: hypothetical protein V4591_10885 [Bdellovibrionota bacterium]